MSLPLAPLFLCHLYVQLDIQQGDERQAGSYHIVTSSVHILSYSIFFGSVVLGIWLRVSLFAIPRRSSSPILGDYKLLWRFCY